MTVDNAKSALAAEALWNDASDDHKFGQPCLAAPKHDLAQALRDGTFAIYPVAEIEALENMATKVEWICTACRRAIPADMLRPGTSCVICPYCNLPEAKPAMLADIQDLQRKVEALVAAVTFFCDHPEEYANSKGVSLDDALAAWLEGGDLNDP